MLSTSSFDSFVPTILILQTRKLRLREGRGLAQGHTDGMGKAGGETQFSLTLYLPSERLLFNRPD